MLESSGSSLVRRYHLESRTKAHQGAESLLVLISLPVLLTQGRRAMGDGVPDVLQSTSQFLKSVEKHYFQQACA